MELWTKIASGFPTRLSGSSSPIDKLQQLYEQRQPTHTLTTPEFASALALISAEIHQPICTYINRRGQVMRVAVGTASQTQIPPQDARIW